VYQCARTGAVRSRGMRERTSLLVISAAAIATFLAPVAAAAAPADGAAVTPVPAASTDESAVTSDRRTLNGHTFMPAADVRWPFATTSLASDLVLAYGKTTAALDIGNQRFEGTVTYAGIGGVLGYEYGFLDHYSVRAVIDDIIYSGIDGRSALTVGTEMQLGFGLGATASWQIGDSIRAGVLLDYSNRPSLGITIVQGLQSVESACNSPAGCSVDVGQIFGVTKVNTVQPAAAVSWAPMKPLGVTANLAYEHLYSTGATDRSGDALAIGAALDWDFAAMASLPVGLQFQVRWTTPISSPHVQHVTDLGGGIWYTGRKDLAAGAQILSRRFAVAPTTDVSWATYLVSLGLRYFW
jgi:hypothetical protein